MSSNSAAGGPRQPTSILIINPNSSKEMTHGMVEAIKSLELGDSIKITNYTAPQPCPASINNDEDIKASDEAVYADVSNGKLKLDQYDATLIACFSVHSLVTRLYDFGPLSITGIFEASISTAQLLLRPHSNEKWGIVTTGKFWEDHLTAGVKSFLGQEQNATNSSFAGVFSTGLIASDFHEVSEEQVTARLQDATQRLFQSGDVKCVVMGCAGMAGLERVIRSTATEMLGEEAAKGVYVVDGVKAGILQIEQMVQSKRIFG